MNISATLNSLRLLWSPTMCLPHYVVPTFNQIPIPLPFPSVKAVVLDKDNCFAAPHDDKVWPEYKEKWEQLRIAYPGHQLLIVSNSAGTNDDKHHKQAKIIEQSTGVHVLRHSTKKPGCKDEILEYFRKNGITNSSKEIVIIGDRLFTDILMANMMGSYGLWVKEGVKLSNSPICKIERFWYSKLKTPLNYSSSNSK